MSKKRHDAGKVLTKVIAVVLAALMVFAVAATVIFYLTIL
jgi:hypothetical protein